MSDYKLPELPSDEELGITKQDREKYDSGPTEGEMSKAELLALLGDTSGSAKGPGGKGGKKQKDKKAPEKTAGAASAAATDGPRKLSRGPLTLALMAFVGAVFSWGGLPRPTPANAVETEFSSARAMSIVAEIARDRHPTGSPDHARVRNYVLDRLRSLGLEPDVQTTTSVIRRGAFMRAATVRNVIARIPGTGSTGAVLVTAHYDSRELSRGAGDDASGVAAILEAVRALQAGVRVRNDIIVLFTDAEELGLLGARAFVDEHPWIEDVSIVLSFEMRGAGGPSIMFETNEENGWIVRALADFDPKPYANSLAYEVYRRLPNDTDFTPFREAGKQGLNFAAIGRPNVYHQSTDTPENLSESTLQHHGIRALAALRGFGDTDLTSVAAPNVVHFSIPFLGMFVYEPAWVLSISGLLIAGYLLFVLLALRRGARPAGALAGLAVAVLGGLSAWGAGVGLLRWTAPLHPEAGSLSAALYHSEGWYMLGLVATVLAIVTTLQGLGRRWLEPHELVAGALFVPVALAGWLAFAMPLGAMNVQWPAIGGVLAALLAVLLRSRWTGPIGWVIALVLALPVLTLLVPVIELLWVTLSLSQAPILAVAIVLAVYMCLPALEFLRQPNAWWAPVTFVVLAGAGIGFGTFAARPSQARPAPSTLVYAYEHGSATALWATDPTADPSVDSAAIAWAAVPGGAPMTETQDMSAFGLTNGEMLVASAPVYDAAPPQLILLANVNDGVVRRVSLGVRSNVGAELMQFQLNDVRLLGINGRPIQPFDSLQWIEHWGQPDSLVVLDLETLAARPLDVHIVEHLFRPQEIVGPEVFRRPDGLAPDVSKGSDRAMLRSSVADLMEIAAADSVAQ